MNTRHKHPIGGRASGLLTIAVCVGIAALLALSYRGTRAWQRDMAQRIADQTGESADLLVKAFTRDMRGAQLQILANRDWDDTFATESLPDMSEEIAIGFARYPYPESFFNWQADGDAKVTFVNRTDRNPAWMPSKNAPQRSPVVVLVDPPIATQMRERIASYAARQLRYAAFDLDFAGEPYQVVARLSYSDSLREHLMSVTGFMVNLAWARRSYFADILSQVTPAARGGLTQDLAVLDDEGRVVAGSAEGDQPAFREFPLAFMEVSDGIADVPSDFTPRKWKVRVSSSRDPMYVWANRRRDAALVATGAAAFVFGISLVLVQRAVFAGVKLTEMRADFVSSVTHELKTPLANIRALASTLARRRPTETDPLHEYPRLVLQETFRLERLVDNVLAYARVTDVAEVYSFEPIAAAELIDDALTHFRTQVADGTFNVRVDMTSDLPFVRADRTSMVLALNNLIDNAIRHSGNSGSIRVGAGREHSKVFIEVVDQGNGIPADELPTVQRKFVRGRFAHADGNGLGLAIVSKVVADHHGTFVIESTPGSGTRCVIRLQSC